jgi:hypothetical protein
MDMYSTALESAGVTTSMLDEGPAVHWDAKRQWRATDPGIGVLIFLSGTPGTVPGDEFKHSFVIAERFSAKKAKKKTVDRALDARSIVGAPLRCVGVGRARPSPGRCRVQMTRASSVNAAATRWCARASIPSS